MSEPTPREHELAKMIDARLVELEREGLPLEAHTRRIREVIAGGLAEYRDEVSGPLYAKASEIPGLTAALAEARDSQEVLARDPSFVLAAAEKMLREVMGRYELRFGFRGSTNGVEAHRMVQFWMYAGDGTHVVEADTLAEACGKLAAARKADHG
jgi:hypothetical protein